MVGYCVGQVMGGTRGCSSWSWRSAVLGSSSGRCYHKERCSIYWWRWGLAAAAVLWRKSGGEEWWVLGEKSYERDGGGCYASHPGVLMKEGEPIGCGESG
jgi:hypothetical protein